MSHIPSDAKTAGIAGFNASRDHSSEGDHPGREVAFVFVGVPGEDVTDKIIAIFRYLHNRSRDLKVYVLGAPSGDLTDEPDWSIDQAALTDDLEYLEWSTRWRHRGQAEIIVGFHRPQTKSRLDFDHPVGRISLSSFAEKFGESRIRELLEEHIRAGLELSTPRDVVGAVGLKYLSQDVVKKCLSIAPKIRETIDDHLEFFRMHDLSLERTDDGE